MPLPGSSANFAGRQHRYTGLSETSRSSLHSQTSRSPLLSETPRSSLHSETSRSPLLPETPRSSLLSRISQYRQQRHQTEQQRHQTKQQRHKIEQQRLVQKILDRFDNIERRVIHLGNNPQDWDIASVARFEDETRKAIADTDIDSRKICDPEDFRMVRGLIRELGGLRDNIIVARHVMVTGEF